jgi:phenylacetate-coenzyme A ligase PaaK-like adenylate-forming protein
MDSLAVQVEYARTIAGDASAIDDFRTRMEAELQMVLGVRTRVAPVPAGSLERTDLKSRRVIDERDLFRSLAVT